MKLIKTPKVLLVKLSNILYSKIDVHRYNIIVIWLTLENDNHCLHLSNPQLDHAVISTCMENMCTTKKVSSVIMQIVQMHK